MLGTRGTHPSKYPTRRILLGRVRQVRVRSGNDSPAIQCHVAAKGHRILKHIAFVPGPENRRSGTSKRRVRAWVVRVARRRGQQRRPGRSRDVLPGCQPDIGALESGHGSPRVVVELGVPSRESGVSECEVELSVELGRSKDVGGKRVANQGRGETVPDSSDAPSAELNMTVWGMFSTVD